MSPHPDDWSCETVADELERLVDGGLSPPEAAAMERHVESCATCQAELQLAEEIRRELRALPHMEAPAAVIEGVKATVRREQSAATRPPARHGRWTNLRPSPVWALAAALLLAAVLAPLVLTPPSPEVAHLETEPTPLDGVELERATDEVRIALAYVGRVSRRAGLEIRDGLIVERLVVPTAEGLSSLRGAPGAGARGEGNET